jgi:hypothetical protein
MTAYRPSLDRLTALVELLGPGPWACDQIMGAGWSRDQLQRAVASGILVRLRRGLYAVPRPVAAAQQLAIPFDSRLARMRAVARSLDSEAAFSHDSAAHAHGQWNPHPPSPLMHVTIPGQSDRQDAGLLVHGTQLPEEFVTVVDGVRVTTVARTAADLARGGDLPAALVVMDGALRLLLSRRIPDLDGRLRQGAVQVTDVEVVRSMLAAAAEPMLGWPGSRTLQAGIRHADPASASPFESWSRGWMVAVGLPTPELNVPVLGASGRRYFGDFVWREHGLIGEADGVGKYGSTGREIRAALSGERARQTDLEEAGWRVVRWVTGDPGAQVVARVSRSLYLGPRLPVRMLGLEA